MKKKYKEACLNIARTLVEEEGSDPSYLSICEAVDEYSTSDIKYETRLKMVSRVEKLIPTATITITFPEESK